MASSEHLDLRPAPKDVWPLRPHCKAEPRHIWVKSKGLGFLQRKLFLLCPHCQAFLGSGSFNYH